MIEVRLAPGMEWRIGFDLQACKQTQECAFVFDTTQDKMWMIYACGCASERFHGGMGGLNTDLRRREVGSDNRVDCGREVALLGAFVLDDLAVFIELEGGIGEDGDDVFFFDQEKLLTFVLKRPACMEVDDHAMGPLQTWGHLLS